jgi:hypothetical protein
MQCNLVGVLMLEIDSLQGAQMSGAKIDISRVADAVKILRSLLPQATEVTSNHEHEFDGALETFARIVNAQRGAIQAREEHVSEILQREVDKLKAENAELRNQIANGPPPRTPAPPAPAAPPQTSKPSSMPPANYLRRNDGFDVIEGGRGRDRWSNNG